MWPIGVVPIAVVVKAGEAQALSDKAYRRHALVWTAGEP